MIKESTTVREIEKEIRELETVLEKAKKEEHDKWRSTLVKTLDDYDTKDIVETFFKLFEVANDMLEKPSNDDEQYSYSLIMNLLAKDKDQFWGNIDKLMGEENQIR